MRACAAQVAISTLSAIVSMDFKPSEIEVCFLLLPAAPACARRRPRERRRWRVPLRAANAVALPQVAVVCADETKFRLLTESEIEGYVVSCSARPTQRYCSCLAPPATRLACAPLWADRASHVLSGIVCVRRTVARIRRHLTAIAERD